MIRLGALILAAAVMAARAGADSGSPQERAHKSAAKHWNLGIAAYAKGDYSRARDEWLLCKYMEPSNPDCQAGLDRIYGEDAAAKKEKAEAAAKELHKRRVRRLACGAAALLGLGLAAAALARRRRGPA